MPPIADHPLRYENANELHARPFPTLGAPSRAAYLAIKPSKGGVPRDFVGERAHLIALLDRYGAPHPQPGATHYSGQIGKHRLKWESHTEFLTYTVFIDGAGDRAFDAEVFDVFPDEWLNNAPGVCVTSVNIHVEVAETDDTISKKADAWFVPESLAISRVLDDELVIAGDFRIDTNGHMRFAVFARPDTGDRRIGRVVQRLCEIETYKAMAMLGLTAARTLGPQMQMFDAKLTAILGAGTASVGFGRA